MAKGMTRADWRKEAERNEEDGLRDKYDTIILRKAAKAYEGAGDTGKARELYGKVADRFREHHTSRKDRNYNAEESAAQNYIAAGTPEKIPKMYEGLGDHEKAAQAWAKLGQDEEAFASFKRAGLDDKTARERIAMIKESRDPEGGLANLIEAPAAVFGILGLVGSIFFLSLNITGNAIGNLTNSTSSWIGGILFVVGLVGAFVYFKKK